MNYFLLVSGSVDSDSGILPGNIAAIERLNSARWPFYINTRNKKKIKSGDRFLIYISGDGAGARSFIGACQSKSEVLSTLYKAPKGWYPATSPYTLLLDDVSLFLKPVPIITLLDDLSFIKSNKAKWGAYLQGGCVGISELDYNQIVKKGKK